MTKIVFNRDVLSEGNVFKAGTEYDLSGPSANYWVIRQVADYVAEENDPSPSNEAEKAPPKEKPTIKSDGGKK